ncbi:MAG: hypothetical protein ABJE95_06740 [Byssovorax sp.]
MAAPHFDTKTIRALVDAAISTSLTSREALLAGINKVYVAKLSTTGSLAELLLLDLNVMNGVALDDGTVPMAEWLENASTLAGPQVQADVFRSALAWIRRPVVAQTAAPATPEPTRAPPPTDAKFATYLDMIEKDVAAQLARMPRVLALLAERLGVPSALVARALLHEKSGKEMVMALNATDEDLKDDATRIAERRALKGILLQLVPVASDWRSYAIDGRARLAAGERFIDLPLANLTVAEAVLAGIACRACQFVSDAPRGPSGAALLRMPAASAFYIDPKHARLVEATVGLVAIHLFNLSPDARELRDPERLRRDVDVMLHHDHEEAIGDARCPHWLLLDDDVLAHDGKSGEPAQQRVAMAVAALGEKLPHLRILSLGEGADDELPYALHIRDMWRKQV